MKVPICKSRLVASLIGAVLAGGVAGCRHAPPPADTGDSSFAFVEPRPASPAKAVPVEAKQPADAEQYTEAMPIRPLATPVYPVRALAAKAGKVTIGVKITVDATGKVTEVGPSLLTVSIPGRFDADFQEAVRTAVSRWRFRPAETYRVETVPLPGGGSYQRMSDHRKVDTTFDLAFTFTASGAVLGAGPGK